MSLVAILELISGVLSFPDKILEMIRIFRKTPTERHDEIVKKIAKEAEQFEETGRPQW
jgi:hypothetical protein